METEKLGKKLQFFALVRRIQVDHYLFFAQVPQILISEGDFGSEQSALEHGSFLYGAREHVLDYVAVHKANTQKAWKITENGIKQI